MPLNKLNLEIAKYVFGEEEEAPAVLKGIWVEPERTIATDGSIVIIVSSCDNSQGELFDNIDGVTPAEFWSGFNLPKEVALRISKAIPRLKKGGNPQAYYAVVDATTENNPRATLSVNDKRNQDILRADKIDGDFPAIDRLLEKAGHASASFFVDAEALLHVSQALMKFRKYHKDVAGLVTVQFHAKARLIQLTMDAGIQSITAILHGTEAEGK